MQYILSILFLLYACLAWSLPALPKDCQLVKLKGSQFILPAKKANLFLIYNQSNQNLWLTHPTKQAGASAGWASQLAPENWSAIKIEDDFELACIESSPGHEQRVSCQKAVVICQFKKLFVPKEAVGAFWVGENLPMDVLLTHIAERGFKLSAFKN
jgi:hypothetical protein